MSCVHHWLIDRPIQGRDGKSHEYAKCKLCGRKRDFQPIMPEDKPFGSLQPTQLRHKGNGPDIKLVKRMSFHGMVAP